MLLGGGVGLLVLVLVFLWWLGGPTPPAPAPSAAGSMPAAETAFPDPPTPSPAVATVAPGMAVAAPGVAMTAQRVAAPPVIDGVAADWADRPPSVSDHVIAPDGATSAVSARWWLSWDDQALYLFASVTDPVITQTHAGEPSQIYRGDSVSFELGPSADQVSIERLDDRDVHVLIGPTEDHRWVRAINVAGGTFLVTGPPWDSGQVVVVPTATGYDVEAAIPWATLHVAPPVAGLVLAANLNVSDAVADGPHRGELAAMLSNNPERTTNAASKRNVWGTLLLEP